MYAAMTLSPGLANSRVLFGQIRFENMAELWVRGQRSVLRRRNKQGCSVRLCGRLFRKHAWSTFPCSWELNLEGSPPRLIPGYIYSVELQDCFLRELVWKQNHSK